MTTLRKVLPLLLLPLVCFAQGNQNNVQLGVVNASASAWKFPTRTFTNLPAAASSTGQRFTVTDCLTSACTAGSGTLRQDMVSTGSAWVPAVTLIGTTAGILYAAADSTASHALFATAGAPAFRAFALTDLPSGDAVGTGTLNVISKWSNTTGGLEDSAIKDDSTAVTITQNSVFPFTSVASGAVANTLHLNAGKVGIGTNSLNVLLEVAAQDATPPIYSTVATSSSSYSCQFLGRKSRGTLASPTALQLGDTLMSILGGGYGATGWKYSVSITSTADETFSDTAAGASWIFATTTPTTATRAERMRISGIGNIGIGTTNPVYSLDVSRGVGLTGTARFFDQTASTGST